MKRLVALAFIMGLSGSAALALPLAPGQAPANNIIKVEGGCGLGFHRGPMGGCRPNREVVVVPGAVVVAPVGPCGGAGRHRVCSPEGRCVMVCN
jgi:hypothetical protein